MDGEEENKTRFFEEMQRFNEETVIKIEDVLKEGKYDLMVEILGLASIVNALIVTYSQSEEEKKQYFETIIYMIEQHQQKHNITEEK